MIVLGPETTSPPAKMPGAAGGQGPRVGHDAGPAAHLDARALGEDRRVGLLADRHEDRGGRQLHHRIRHGRPDGAAAVDLAGRSLLGAAEGHDRAVAPDDLGDRQARPDRDPLALGRLDLLLLGRHVGPAAAVGDRDRRGAAAEGGAGGVHRRAPAADHHHGAREPGMLAEVDLLEEEGRGDHAGQAVAGHAEPAALRGAGGEEDGLEAFALQVAEREVAAHRRVEPELDAEADDPLDLRLEDLARQAVLGDPDRHHAAGHGHRLEDGDRVAEAGQVVRGRHAGRARRR